MGKKVQNKDLFSPGLFKPTAKNAKTLIKVLNKLEEQLKDVLKESQKIAKLDTLKSFKGAKEIEGAIKKIVKATQLLEQVEKKRKQAVELVTKAEKKATVAKDKAAAASKRQAKSEERLLKAAEKQAKATKKAVEQFKIENGVLGKLQSTIKRLKKEQLFAKTPAQLSKVNKKLREAQREFRKLSSIGKRSTNSFGKAIQSFGFKFNILSDVISEVGFALTNFVRQGVGNAIDTLRTFEKGNAVLAGVLNKTRKEVVGLTNDALRLGEITVKTAEEVTGLQIAYSRLGFSQEDIINLTEATIQGSIALNAELDETAALTGAVVKTFDEFSTLDAPEILDKLTVSTQRSALQFESLQTALPIVGGAANAAGVDFDTLLALLGKLADSGIDASMSSTALRNIFIESAAQGLNYSQILDKISKEQDKLTASNDEFGKRAAVSTTILSKNIKETDKLRDSISKAGGTAARVAKEQLNTLDGAIQLLTSAYDGLILSTNEGDSVTTRLADTLRFIARNLRTIVKILGLAIISFVSYKAAVLAARAATVVYATATRAAAFVQSIFTKGTKLATISMKGFNTAVKANPFGLLFSVLTTVITAIVLFTTSTEDATEAQEGLNKEVANGAKILASIEDSYDIVNGVMVQTTNFTDNLNKKIKELNKDGLEALATTLKDRIVQGLRDVKKEQNEFIKDAILLEVEKFRGGLESVNKELLILLDLEENLGQTRLPRLIQDQAKVVSDLAKAVKQASTEQEIFNKNKQLEIAQKELQRLQALGKERNKLTGAIELQAKAVADLQAQIQKANESDIVGLKEKLTAEEAELTRLRELGESKKLIDIEREQLRQDIAAQEIALAEVTDKSIEDLANTRLENEIQALRSRLEVIKETGEDELELKRELNDKLIELEKNKGEKEESIRNEIQEATLNRLGDNIEIASNNRIEAFDDEIRATIERQAQLLIAANNGVLNAQESLAEEQANQAKLELAKKKEQEKQERLLAAFKIISALIESGEPVATALPKTAVLLEAVPAVINALPSFDVGTEYVDTSGAKRVDNKGGMQAVVHDGERIFTEDQNAMIGNIGNWEAANILSDYQTNKSNKSGSSPKVIIDLDRVVKAIENIPVHSTDYDVFNKIIKEKIKQGNKIVNTSRKNRL